MIHAYRFFCFSEYVCYCDRREVDELLSSKTYFANAVNLLETLDDMREAFNAPIMISSGFRNRDHNARVNGSVTSQHLIGAAADIKLSHGYSSSFMALAEYFFHHPQKFGQVICYIPDALKEEVLQTADLFPPRYDYDRRYFAAQLKCSHWIHVALPSAKHDHLCITQNYLKV